MAELDQMWMTLLEQATSRAEAIGENDLAEYLRLKIANDTIRRAGVDWLFTSFLKETFETPEIRKIIKVDRLDPHTFRVGNSTMVGSMIEIRRGVRCLSIEAGWVRTPSDGVMRNGSLAQARIQHFGMPRFDVELVLIAGESLPTWFGPNGKPFCSMDIRRHLDIFLER